MKIISKIILLLSLVTISCNPTGLSLDKSIVRINASLNGFTKATDTAFEEGDGIGLFITTGSDAFISNARFEFKNGSFSSDVEHKWYEDRQLVSNVFAYYPYNKSISLENYSITIPRDQNIDRLYKSADLLLASTTATPNDEIIRLNFHHAFSKLDISVVNNTNIGIEDLVFDNITITGTVDIINQTIKVSEELSSVSSHYDGNGHYSMILLPQVAKPQLIIQFDDYSEITYNLDSEVRFTSGKRYKAEVVIDSKTDISLKILSDIQDWLSDDNIKFQQGNSD